MGADSALKDAVYLCHQSEVSLPHTGTSGEWLSSVFRDWSRVSRSWCPLPKDWGGDYECGSEGATFQWVQWRLRRWSAAIIIVKAGAPSGTGVQRQNSLLSLRISRSKKKGYIIHVLSILTKKKRPLISATDQKLELGKAWERGYTHVPFIGCLCSPPNLSLSQVHCRCLHDDGRGVGRGGEEDVDINGKLEHLC